MSKSYVIEVGDDQAGVIIREEGEREYHFHAALDRIQRSRRATVRKSAFRGTRGHRPCGEPQAAPRTQDPLGRVFAL